MEHKTICVKFRVPKEHVVYLNSIIDSYEGAGITRTIDPQEGKVIVISTQGMYRVVLDILEDAKKQGIPVADIATAETEDIDVW